MFTDVFMKIGKEKLGLNEGDKDSLSKLRKEVEEIELKKRKTAAEDFFAKRERKNSN